MHKPPLYERGATGDPLLDRVDALITWAIALREDIVREREAQQRDRDGMLKAAGQIARSDYMTNKEVADHLGRSVSAIQHAGDKPDGPLHCIYRGRIGKGRSVKYARRRIEAHLRNMDERKHCGDCDQVSFSEPRRAK